MSGAPSDAPVGEEAPHLRALLVTWTPLPAHAHLAAKHPRRSRARIRIPICTLALAFEREFAIFNEHWRLLSSALGISILTVAICCQYHSHASTDETVRDPLRMMRRR
ncbi:hypothetical protein FB451DRAFT_1401413 [Mycena latifolia]|nr:hypothetical protein FB451DRAFT_1401413 [Mycena latifolia]